MICESKYFPSRKMWALFGAPRHCTMKTRTSFGPWTPIVSVISISAVREGPVINTPAAAPATGTAANASSSEYTSCDALSTAISTATSTTLISSEHSRGWNRVNGCRQPFPPPPTIPSAYFCKWLCRGDHGGGGNRTQNAAREIRSSAALIFLVNACRVPQGAGIRVPARRGLA